MQDEEDDCETKESLKKTVELQGLRATPVVAEIRVVKKSSVQHKRLKEHDVLVSKRSYAQGYPLGLGRSKGETFQTTSQCR
jgi:hypothetical protein